MKKTNPFVSIVIANFNGEKYLETCLQSVLKTSYDRFEVIVVDDGSTDKSRKIIESFAKKSKKIQFIKNEKNIGLSRSRNRAIKASKGEILVFLDNDTEVTPLWIKHICKVLLSNEKIGAVQSKLVEFDKREKIQLVGTKLIPYTGWSIPIGVGEKKQAFSSPIEIVGIGAAFAVKKNVINAIKGFDPYMVYFNEDLDYSWRIWICGWKVLLAPDSIVYHWTKSPDMRRNTNSTHEKIYYHMCRNSVRSLLKNYEVRSLLYYFPINLAILFGRAILVFVKRNDASSIKGTVKSLAWNALYIVDTLKERSRIQKIRQNSDAKLFPIIMMHGSPMDIYIKYFQSTKLL